MSSNVQAWRTPVIEPSGAYINSLVDVIQTCGWACAAVEPNIPKRATSSQPIRRDGACFISDHRRFQQTAAAEQGIRRGLPAAEGDIGIFRIARTAGGIDVVVQALGDDWVEDVAG